MKTSRYILLSLAAVAIAASCKEELNPDKPINANPGDEVVFGAALPGKTKTVYGEETSTGFPIYWVNGDLVKVASPQCMSGRNSAEYSVNTKNPETGEVKVDQNFATSLDKTGDAGVQWGDAETADFYSIYPSTAGTELTVSGGNVVAKLHVDATQFASTSNKTDSKGKAYVYAQPAEMGNVIMYAKTMGVNRNDPKTKGVVELHYTPFSTVLEFELTAPESSDASHQSEITIQSITLVAPTGKTIAGDFTFNFPTENSTSPSVEAAAGGNNAITLHFLDNNQYTTVLSTTKTTLKAKMCLMPISEVESILGWKIAVNTSAGTFTKTIKDTDLTGKNTALAPGKVHKVKLPSLKYASQEWIYNTANWITSLPDYTNIYLSEISLPGAWYAGSTESYQATNDIATLWKAGVRAFAVETRTTSTGSNWLFGNVAQTTPNGIALSGSQTNSIDSYSAGTNSLDTGSTSDAKVSYKGTSIATIITNIANQVKSDEFGVLVLSYADGGNSGHRPVDYGAWLQLLYDAYNGLASTVKEKIYQGQVTANTTVNSVLGKLILKINVDANIAMSGSVSSTNFAYANNLPALFSYNPFLIQMEGADYTRPYYSNLSWSNWGDDTNYRTYDLVANLSGILDAANKFIWVFSSANRTHTDNPTTTIDIPTYSDRQTALGAMMEFSKRVYDGSNHNVWFYFNCGGTQATSSTSSSPSPTDFASTMNSWLLKTINAKTDASPLGIVMFNQCTNDTYNGPAIVKAIIEMNSKFYLKHAGTSGGSTGGNATPTAENDGTVLSGGEAI